MVGFCPAANRLNSLTTEARMTELARRLFCLIVAALAISIGLSAPASAQVPNPSFSGSEARYAAIVVDANSGEVLFAKSADSQRYPASITKVMTLYLAFEAVASGKMSLTDNITISPRAAAQAPTKLGLRAGETITVADAIRAISVKSANDIAVAMAEKIGGTESRFAALMTLRARELGMSNTRFANASGLPDSRQLSSARDLAILSRAVMRDYPQFYTHFGQRQFVYRGNTMKNHNNLLGKMPGVDGLKTGFTNASGFNLAASAVRNNRRLIAVVLGGNSGAARDNHVQDLLETGFEVLSRRQRGEVITVAQNLFEPAPIGPIVRPSVEQGDAEQAGLRVIIDNKPELRAGQPTADKKDKASKSKSADAVKAKADNAKGEFLVQVGAFRQKSLAQTELKRISRKFSGQFSDATGRVESANSGEYRARFAGLSGNAARQACASLKAAGQVCVVIAP
jgi:D-alanyl-D-alanine carboxypeptidase